MLNSDSDDQHFLSDPKQSQIKYYLDEVQTIL